MIVFAYIYSKLNCNRNSWAQLYLFDLLFFPPRFIMAKQCAFITTMAPYRNNDSKDISAKFPKTFNLKKLVTLSSLCNLSAVPWVTTNSRIHNLLMMNVITTAISFLSFSCISKMIVPYLLTVCLLTVGSVIAPAVTLLRYHLFWHRIILLMDCLKFLWIVHL